MKLKKIAFIIPMLQPYRITFYESLVEKLTEYNFTFLHGVSQKDNGRPAYDGETTIKTIPLYEKAYSLGPYTIVILKDIIKQIKIINPEIIIMFGNPGALSNQLLARFAKKRGIKLIYWVCSYESEEITGIIKKIKDILSEKYYNKADRFITYSTHAKNKLLSLGISSDKINIAFNGIDIKPFYNIENDVNKQSIILRKEIDAEDKIIFLYVGGFSKMKKMPLLIKTFLKIEKIRKDIELWIIGDGPDKQELHEMANNANRIKFFGRISGNEVNKYFKAADCLIVPGAGGLAINQSFFWETPAIVSFTDGTEEDLVLDNKTGFRFKLNSEKDLERCIMKFLNLPKNRIQEMGEMGKEIVINKSNTKYMLDVFEKTITEIANK